MVGCRRGQDVFGIELHELMEAIEGIGYRTEPRPGQTLLSSIGLWSAYPNITCMRVRSRHRFLVVSDAMMASDLINFRWIQMVAN